MAWKGILRVGLVVLVGLVLLSGLGCVKKLPIPEHTNMEPIDVQFGEKLDAVAFAGAVATIPRGTLITAYHAGYNNSWDCWLGGHVYWSSWQAFQKDGDGVLSNAFYETLKSLGYNVVGDPSILFNKKREMAKAKYQVGARILDLKKNICKYINPWTKRFTGKDSGEVYIKIEWSLYSEIKQETVMKHITTGYYLDENGLLDGEAQLFMGAFSNALENFASRQEFYDLVARKKKDIGKKYTGPIGDEIRIPKIGLFDEQFAQNVATVNNAVVTIRTGGGHGSGFIISKDGYIITNNHVVGDADEVAVRFGQQLELVGKVLKRDPVRDVALIKVGLSQATAIPLNLNGAKIAGEVYAIGSPQDIDLNNTITKGVVSAVRFDSRMGIRVIQSDVSTLGGNSGGPVTDDKGNVIAIVCYGRLGKRIGEEVPLNFFIPIEDALEVLNIEIDDKS
jgi:serine protease Do